jgi:hypothetical protein
MRGRSSGLILALAAIAATLIGATGIADGAEAEVATVAAGRLCGIGWTVEVAPDEGRRGICFGVGYDNPTSPFDVQCSAPAEKRGIVTSVESEHRHSRHGAITVVGMAMNAAVAKVKVKTCSGKVEVRRPKKPQGPGSGLGHIADYRYVAFAVRGPWCAEQIITYDQAGDALFEGPAFDI